MTRRQLRRRIRARLCGDGGFTIIESMIAITVLFGSLTALMYTATLGFRTIAYGRERITGAGIANQIMEEVRGTAYARVQAGLLTTDMTGDSRIVDCSGVKKLDSCTAGSGGIGETIISSTGAATTTWLNPHRGTIGPSSTTNNITYTWSVYVTNNNIAANPYRVSVIVTWASAVLPNAPNNLVRIESLFWSPSGCVSSTTHPFAAPCQPFFYGDAAVPAGRINISGSIEGTTFASAYLQATGGEAVGQTEQVSELTGTATESAVSVTDGTSTTTDGGATTTSTAADSDPAQPGATYQDSGALTGAGGTVTKPSSGTTQFSATAPAGDTYRADAAVSASGTSVCPPPTDTAESDSLPCAGSRIQQGGSVTSTLLMTGIVNGLGTANLANMAAVAANPNKALVNRTAVANQNGRLDATVTRRFGTINIGGLPSGMTSPAGWTGYLMSITGYQDSATAYAGTTAPVNTSSVAGSVSYWNGASYTSLAINNAGLNNITPSVSRTQTIAGQTVVTTISVQASTAVAATTVSTQTGTVGATVTDAEVDLVPFGATVNYVVTVGGVTKVNLVMTLALGTGRAKSIYGAPPARG